MVDIARRHLTVNRLPCILQIMTKVVHRLRGYVRPLPRVSEASQRALLHERGVAADKIYTEGHQEETLDALIRSLRAGEVVAVTRVHILAAPKERHDDRPRRALWTAVHAIEAKGAAILEVESRRSTASSARERDEMIADAIEQITHSGRSPRKRDTPGRPPMMFSPEDIEAARRVWADRKIATWGEVREQLPKGFSTWRAYKMFGPRVDKAKTPKKEPKWVYFARAGRGNRVKIGTTSSVTSRMKALSHPLVGKLRVIGVVPGGYEVEARMHQRFAEYRIKGEWFRLEDELAEFVAGLRKSKPK